MKRIVIVFTVMMLLLAGAMQAQDKGYKVIVNAGNAAAALPKAKLSKIFLKQEGGWAPVDQTAASPARDAFSKDVHGRTASTIKSYWQSQIFSGREVPPPEKGGDAAVVAYVKGNPQAIGYVSAAADVSGVKVIKVGP